MSEEELDFNSYQYHAAKTATYKPQDRLIYTSLGLSSEAGEVAGKVKKVLRDSDGMMTDEQRIAILDELGDVLWYVSAVATDLGANLEDVALHNLAKLQDRADRDKISGDGDKR